MIFERIIEQLDRFTIVAAAFSTLFSLVTLVKTWSLRSTVNALQAMKQTLITIRIRTEGVEQYLELPYRPRRDQLSRQELMGILGLYFGANRFDSTHLRPLLESGELNRVISGRPDGDSNDNDSDINRINITLPLSDFRAIQSTLHPSPIQSGVGEANALERW